MNYNDKKWLTEYETFLRCDDTAVPKSVTEKIFSVIQNWLHPSALAVFLKILGIHIVIGFLSLAVCHQFGMNPFGTENSLDRWLMAMWGHKTCMILCGVIFVGLSLLSAGYFLTLEEIKVLKKTEFAQILALGAVSLTILGLAGAELKPMLSGLWFVGAFVGGFFATETVWKWKRGKILTHWSF